MPLPDADVCARKHSPCLYVLFTPQPRHRFPEMVNTAGVVVVWSEPRILALDDSRFLLDGKEDVGSVTVQRSSKIDGILWLHGQRQRA